MILFLVGLRGQDPTALQTASLEGILPPPTLHAVPEAMFPLAAPLLGLVSSLGQVNHLHFGRFIGSLSTWSPSDHELGDGLYRVFDDPASTDRST